MNVLVVETDPSTQALLQSTLLSMGHETTLSETPETALQLCRSGNYPLIILDQVLPDRDGFELCRQIRGRDALSVILMISPCSASDLVDFVDAAPDDILISPIEESHLRLRLALAEQRILENLHGKQAEYTAGAMSKAMEIMQLGVTIVDKEGRILYSNGADERMHGYDPDELIGQHVRLFSPSSRWNWMTTDQMENVRRWRRESVNVRKDGTLFSVNLVSDVVRNSRDQVVGMVTVCEDLTHMLDFGTAVERAARLLKS